MKKIIIFGVGNSSEILEKYIDYSKVEIVGYSDNDKNKIGNKHKNVFIYNPNDLASIECDYIILAPRWVNFRKQIFNQLISIGVSQNKIIDIYDFISPLETKIKQINEYTQVLVSGISYFKHGIDEKLINNCVNMAIESQDLYYDYNVIKYIFDNKKLKNIKCVIIGLCYYSFQYDLSKSYCSRRVNFYAETLGDFHNYSGDKSKLMEDKRFIEEKSKEIFKKEYKMLASDLPDAPLTADKIKAYNDSNKNYPKTVKENEQIFNEYLKLLYGHNIKIIVTVAPTTQYYYNNFSKSLRDEFINIIEKYKEIYKFKFCDYFNSEEFKIDEFTDVSHLNKKGAIKYTNILNKNIKNII